MAVLVGQKWGKISNFIFFNPTYMDKQIQSSEEQEKKKKKKGNEQSSKNQKGRVR